MTEHSAPVWGCPWHGLVRNGQLELANGDVMDFPQYGAAAGWQRGMAVRVANPAVSDIELPVATEDGRQWRNWAVLAGNRSLHGIALPADSWIYIDPAGERWLVTTTLAGNWSTAPTTATLRLVHFGVIGGSYIAHEYSVPVPDLQQSEPEIDGLRVISAATFDMRPDGSGAIFMIYTRWTTQFDAPRDDDLFGGMPLGWLEVSLSGPGDECAVSIRVLKSRAQTLGAVSDSDLPSPDARFFLETTMEASVPEPGRLEVNETYTFAPVSLSAPNPGGLYELRVQTASGTASRSVVGYVLACWYSSDSEAIDELMLSINENISFTSELKNISPGTLHAVSVNGVQVVYEYTPANLTWAGETSTDTAVTLALNGAAVAHFPITYRANKRISLDRHGDLRGWMETAEINREMNGGSDTDLSEMPFPPFSNRVDHTHMYQAQIPGSWQNWLSDIARIPRPGSGNPDVLAVLRASNAVFGFIHIGRGDGEVTIPPTLATPYGAVTADIPTPGNGGRGDPPVFASLEPLTGQLSLDSGQICYT